MKLWHMIGNRLELWSTKYRVLHVSLDPFKWTFSGDYISAIRRCCPGPDLAGGGRPEAQP